MLDCSWHTQGVYYAYLDCIVQYLVRIRSAHIKYAYLSVFDLYFHTYLNVFDKYVKIHSRYTQIHATKTVCIWSFANTHRIRINTRIYANTLKYALNTIKYGGVKSESIWSKNREASTYPLPCPARRLNSLPTFTPSYT